MNAGIDNALKMRKMFEADRWYEGGPKRNIANFECCADYIKLEIHPVHPNGFVERCIVTYTFRDDGTYTAHAHA